MLDSRVKSGAVHNSAFFMSEVKLIKRYANRRLYDAETSKTITLEDVAEFIKKGNEIRVVDNITGEDITAKVLGQTFLKISTDQQNLEFSIFLLSSLIREVSNNLSGFFSRLVQGGIGAGALTFEKLERIVQSMVEQGDLSVSEKVDYVDRLLSQLRKPDSVLKSRAEEGIGVLKHELFDNRNRKIEELSDKIEEMARIISDIQKK